MRGDEPAHLFERVWLCSEFPACAGMNRLRLASGERTMRVPRMRGDEPVNRGYGMWRPACGVPRMRGDEPSCDDPD